MLNIAPPCPLAPVRDNEPGFLLAFPSENHLTAGRHQPRLDWRNISSIGYAGSLLDREHTESIRAIMRRAEYASIAARGWQVAAIFWHGWERRCTGTQDTLARQLRVVTDGILFKVISSIKTTGGAYESSTLRLSGLYGGGVSVDIVGGPIIWGCGHGCRREHRQCREGCKIPTYARIGHV